MTTRNPHQDGAPTRNRRPISLLIEIGGTCDAAALIRTAPLRVLLDDLSAFADTGSIASELLAATHENRPALLKARIDAARLPNGEMPLAGIEALRISTIDGSGRPDTVLILGRRRESCVYGNVLTDATRAEAFDESELEHGHPAAAERWTAWFSDPLPGLVIHRAAPTHPLAARPVAPSPSTPIGEGAKDLVPNASPPETAPDDAGPDALAAFTANLKRATWFDGTMDTLGASLSRAGQIYRFGRALIHGLEALRPTDIAADHWRTEKATGPVTLEELKAVCDPERLDASLTFSPLADLIDCAARPERQVDAAFLRELDAAMRRAPLERVKAMQALHTIHWIAGYDASDVGATTLDFDPI